MNYLEALITVLVPFIVMVFPGVTLARHYSQSALQYLARVVLWSISIWTLLSFVTTLTRAPLLLVVIAVIALTIAAWRWRAPWSLSGKSSELGEKQGPSSAMKLRKGRPVAGAPPSSRILLIIFMIVLLYAFFGWFFLQNHDGLPTGDSQKAIFWAEVINTTQSLPDYSVAPMLLNRDPVDFYTPGLHTLTALITRWAPAPLPVVGFFSILVAIGVALLAASTTALLIPRAHWTILVGAAVLVLMNGRFLRYVREPGYHLQNVVGELLLFGVVWATLSLLKQWRWPDVILIIFGFASLLLTHQFSAFLAFFILLPVVVCLGIHYARHQTLRRYLAPVWLSFFGMLLLLSISVAISVGLHHKIPHIFTFNAHLRSLILPLGDYPRTLGYLWVYGGLIGLVLLLRFARPWREHLLRLAFVGVSVVVLVLSQGPRFGIDIPPVRALLYTVWPLSIATSFFVYLFYSSVPRNWRLSRHVVLALVVVVISSIGAASFARAIAVDHAVRSNSTLTSAQLGLIEALKNQPESGHIISDDYNRRSSSWLLLANHGMYSRVAAEGQTQMAEAEQSPLRRQLYLRQLDIEKIYALGSLPDIRELLTATNTKWLVGVEGSSATAFNHNPLLTQVSAADDFALFSPRAREIPVTLDDATRRWLYRPSTLANDIGDDEDTFEHLPASIRSARLSPPRNEGAHTYRSSSAPIIPLRFNVNDFVQPLLNPNSLTHSDTTLEFYLQLLHPAKELRLQTTTGYSLPVVLERTRMQLPSSQVTFDDGGFVTLYLMNPTQAIVDIDLIALGLAQVP